jgi:hypothetical protein
MLGISESVVGEVELARMTRVIKYYERYEGEQVWDGYKKPTTLDYDPTTLTINFDRLLVDTMAAWEFEMNPKWEVEPDVIDDPIDMVREGYEASNKQDAENRRAAAKETLLNRVHRENRTHEKLLESARDRKIAGTVWAKLTYDKRTGKLRTFFRSDAEVVAVYNQEDNDMLEEVHFLIALDDVDSQIWKQSYYLEWDDDENQYECFVHEATYNLVEDELEIESEKVPKTAMGLDFIPVVAIPNDRLAGMTRGYSEINKFAEITDEINRKLSDYSDAIRFEMFAITLLMNVDNDKGLSVAPGAMWNLQGAGGLLEGERPDAKKLESNFKFKEAVEAYIDRLYSNLHKIAEVPSVNTAEMNVGGINDMAMKLLFSSIISKTQRSWVIWKSRLELLNEYTLRYMKARKDDANFSYNKSLVDQIDNNYLNTVHFRLPLPEDQVALIEQLTTEMASDLESIKGALARKGVENPEAKLMEILSERSLMRNQKDPYGGEGNDN